MKGHPILYTARERAWIKRHCALLRREAHALFCQRFHRAISVENFKALCVREGWTTGRTGRFAKGVTPHNKGQAMPYHPNSARHRFQKGNLPHNTNYLGHERVSKDGYVEISVAQRNPHTGFERRYALKHKYLWEQQHGPVPTGHALKCLDGNRRNTDPSNWVAISRSLLPFINGHRGPHYDHAVSEVKPALLTLAKLKQARYAKTKRRAR